MQYCWSLYNPNAMPIESLNCVLTSNKCGGNMQKKSMIHISKFETILLVPRGTGGPLSIYQFEMEFSMFKLNLDLNLNIWDF